MVIASDSKKNFQYYLGMLEHELTEMNMVINIQTYDIPLHGGQIE